MGNCYSADHIAEDHIQTDRSCNVEESQQKYCLGTVHNKLLGGLKHVLLDPNPRPLFCSGSKYLVPMKVS